MRVAEFDYHLPDQAIAQQAIEPRDAARLLLARSMEDRVFTQLPEILSPGDLLVVNQTRVRAARLVGVKEATGGAVELLLLRRIDADRWEGLVRPARRIRRGTRLDFGTVCGEVCADPADGVAVVTLTTPHGDVDDALPAVGAVPLPPYFHGTLPDPERYQTVFAKSLGSAAAPTAALHFTPDLVARLADAGIGLTEVELDIGLDTFRPMATEHLADHTIHTEQYRVPEAAAAAISAAREIGGRVVAVGTTVVRTLETEARAASSSCPATDLCPSMPC
jgi:S-adenosylmethionine:tRNA ribosyltransferase-isomerase